ncbi:MAG: hypothetical protein IKO23_01990 [Bacteroidales bacterium]|nr:hypothetical protein [Bacteroidales bacterium]
MGVARFTGNEEFKHMLDSRKQDILQRTSDGVQETPQFQRLFSILAECRRKNEERDFRLILISNDDLSNLCSDAAEKAHSLFRHPVFLTNRTVYVDAQLSIRNCNNDPFPIGENNARRYFASLTNEGLVAFHIAPNATVNYFIQGRDYGDGVFYTREALLSYEERKTIEHLENVLDDYRIHLTHQDAYLKFFVDKTGLRALHALTNSSEHIDAFISANKHVLKNKPEYLFQEDIRNYINQHMRVVVTREVVLENLDRLDIELTDQGGNDLYFIEIKWVGESIGPNNDSIPTKFDAQPRIRPNAVRQVAGYIDQLLKENKNIKYGYLAVFDARKEDLDDTGKDITETDLPEGLRKHYPRFVKLKDFRVKNVNPR